MDETRKKGVEMVQFSKYVTIPSSNSELREKLEKEGYRLFGRCLGGALIFRRLPVLKEKADPQEEN